MKLSEKLVCFTLTAVLAGLSVAEAAVPAFPGAEGAGRYTTGGRGGSVYHVTNLDDDPSNPPMGSLRYYINKTDTRTIVFDVAGTIFLKDGLNINSGNLTIAGQTAPGDGICIAGYPVHVNASNIILRFLRIRMGDLHPEVEDDALGGRGINNVVIDHCSCSWSVDECVSFYGDGDFTMQWCFITESLRYSNHVKGAHGYGGIWGGPRASFHHNLLAHHSSRTPRLGWFYGVRKIDHVDLRNNVIYNYGRVVGAYGGEGADINLINCYYKPGPSTTTGDRRGMLFGPGNVTDEEIANGDPRPKWGHMYVSGNWCSSMKNTSSKPSNATERATTDNNWSSGVAKHISGITATELAAYRLSEPFSTGMTTTHTAQVAFEKVLNTGGCSLSRDTIDRRIVKETRNGTATFKGSVSGDAGLIDTPTDLKPKDAPADWSAWPTLEGGEVPLDTDRDGMPDDWETEMGLNPRYPLDRNKQHESGYTYLEVYLNSLVQHIVEQELADFEYIANGDANDIYTDIYHPVFDTPSTTEGENKVWYDLRGHRIVNPSSRGLYVQNGKKMILK